MLKRENKLTNHLRALLESVLKDGQTLAIGLSGGMDSICLLEAALPLASKWRIAACHVNHQISPRACAWEAFCRQWCRQRDIELFVFHAGESGEPIAAPADICKTDAGPAAMRYLTEEQARQIRFRAFASMSVDAIVLAHHAKDQAETVLFRMLRGTSAYGMGAMRACTQLPGAPHILLLRPWLNIDHQQITEYARRRRLQWVEDEDNRNVARRRNFLRHRVMPVLQEYFPDSERILSASSSRFSQASALLTELADEDEKRASDGDRLDMAYFYQVGLPRLQNWLHVFVSRQTSKFSERGLSEIARQLFMCRGKLTLNFAGLTFCVWRRQLYVDDIAPPDFFCQPIKLGQERQHFPQIGGALVRHLTIGGGLSEDKITTGLTARLRVGGERLQLQSNRCKTVSGLLRKANIAPWWRQRLPLLFVGNVLAAVPGIAVAETFRAADNEKGVDYRMEWHRNSHLGGRHIT